MVAMREKKPRKFPTYLGIKRAVELMRLPDHRLMLMHTPAGLFYFVVPGGPIERSDAEKIITRPDVHAFDDGLFPGSTQSWKIG